MKIKSLFNPSILALMSLSMMALLSFLMYWLAQSYQSEKLNLRRDASYLLMNSARIVEDSLIRGAYHDVMDQGEVTKQRVIMADTAIHQAIKYKRSDSSELNVSVIKRHGRPPVNGKGRRNFPGTIGLHLEGADDMNPHVINKIISDLLVSQLGRTVLTMELPHDIKLNPLSVDSFQYSSNIYSHIYSDIVTGFSVNLVITNFKGFLLKKMLPEIITALLLFALTFLTVWILFKSMIKERQLSETRKNLMANISHELKTPITSIGLALEAMQSETDSNKRLSYSTMAISELSRLSSLVERIMMGVSSKQVNVDNLAYVDLSALTKEIVMTQNLYIERMNGQVKIVAPEQAIMIKMNKIQMTSVLNNLLENALKYSQPQPDINIEVKQLNNEVVWRITDNGCGIPKRYHKQIFENLFRVPTGNLHDIKGHGLGLHFVKEVVEGHGGQVAVQSDGSSWTTFELKFNSKA